MRSYRLKLNSTYLFQSSERTVLLDSLQTFHGDVDYDGLPEFSDVNAALLEVGLAAYLPSRIELGRTSTVGVPSANLRALPSDFTSSCHNQSMVA